MNRILHDIKLFLKYRFNFTHEQNDNIETINSIEKGVDFKGINVWTLIFAIIIASIGLNVNSTAVIIGAMLISPLMGPIMGLGLSVGIYDFVLLKKSFRNLVVAVVISVLTSAIYFYISPLNEAQSELLSRTTPTIYDVLIALFGGFAGIVAGSSKEKGNAIPGVAIATALMPPLCTAGYGIATGNLLYFLGAFYLFFINTVMISFSTFLFVRFLKFPLKHAIDKSRENSVKKYIYIIVILTVLPSIYFAYQIIQQAIFKNNALTFINKEFNFDKAQVIDKSFIYKHSDSNEIDVLVVGERIDDKAINLIEKKMPKYSLSKTKLIVKQGFESSTKIDVNQIKSGIIEEIYHKNELTIKDKDEKIKLLENKIRLINYNIPITKICEEINVLTPKVEKFSAYKTVIYDIKHSKNDTTIIVYLSTRTKLKKREFDLLNKWLIKRLEFSNIKMIAD
jgi:uncharacterized hydrophobic protein (TIGR00271 family)